MSWRSALAQPNLYSLQILYDAFRVLNILKILSPKVMPAIDSGLLSLFPSEHEMTAEHSTNSLQILEILEEMGHEELTQLAFAPRVLSILSCNAHRFGDNSCAVFVAISAAFNHSCTPNCTTSLSIVDGRPIMSISTIVPVCAQEELTIAYLPVDCDPNGLYYLNASKLIRRTSRDDFEEIIPKRSFSLPLHMREMCGCRGSLLGRESLGSSRPSPSGVWRAHLVCTECCQRSCREKVPEVYLLHHLA
jgi:hypothetical protein